MVRCSVIVFQWKMGAEQKSFSSDGCRSDAKCQGIIRGVRKARLSGLRRTRQQIAEDIYALEIGNLLDSDHIDVSRDDGSIGARINFRSNEFNYYYIRVNEHSMDSQQKNGQAIIICKQCGSEFSCGSDANSGQCWCHDLPNVMPLTEQARTSEDCYCQQCLEEIISKKITTKP